MKIYTVYFAEKVCRKYLGDRFNRKTLKWENVEMEEWSSVFNFHSLALAKKLIKENLDKYRGSCIVKIWNNGDREDLGEIKLKGSNKTFVANTK